MNMHIDIVIYDQTIVLALGDEHWISTLSEMSQGANC